MHLDREREPPLSTTWTQAEGASPCGVTQPRIDDLLRGPISRSLDALVNIATALGCRVRATLDAARAVFLPEAPASRNQIQRAKPRIVPGSRPSGGWRMLAELSFLIANLNFRGLSRLSKWLSKRIGSENCGEFGRRCGPVCPTLASTPTREKPICAIRYTEGDYVRILSSFSVRRVSRCRTNARSSREDTGDRCADHP
jgi:Helix-turn-helix domain